MEVPLIEAGEPEARSWFSLLLSIGLPIALSMSTLLTIFILTLPTRYDRHTKHEIEEDAFSAQDRENPESNKALKPNASVTVLVLGDIGRSPRMQYHVASIAAHGGRVSLIGYLDSELLPEIRNNHFVTLIPLSPPPEALRNSSSKMLFPIIAPLKVLWQIGTLWHACGYRAKPTEWMLVQNPPSIPTLVIAQAMCFIRHTRLLIDWHNFGYTILALKLGNKHPLVRISECYEQYAARAANAHFSVTNAMARVLKQKFGVEATPLHDRPASQFQPLTQTQRSDFLHRLPETASHAKHFDHGTWKLVVSSTSWTADEDFSLLLDALVAYSATVSMSPNYPKIHAIITGKGPQKEYYVKKIAELKQQKKLSNVTIQTAWLSTEDYALLLGSADLGVSLHTSSSGVDLPMKVVDMFGAGLPVVGWGRFEAWKELVKEGVNGFGFSSASGLEQLLEELFGGNGRALKAIRRGALEECNRRWEDEWFPVAGKLLGLHREGEPRRTEDAADASTRASQSINHQTSTEQRPTVQSLPTGQLVTDSAIFDAEVKRAETERAGAKRAEIERVEAERVEKQRAEVQRAEVEQAEKHRATETKRVEIEPSQHEETINESQPTFTTETGETFYHVTNEVEDDVNDHSLTSSVVNISKEGDDEVQHTYLGRNNPVLQGLV
jgi:beta-1,4-mannosyltransferase